MKRQLNSKLLLAIKECTLNGDILYDDYLFIYLRLEDGSTVEFPPSRLVFQLQDSCKALFECILSFCSKICSVLVLIINRNNLFMGV